jgi:uncharacterized protein YjiS (DUF1127 family)
MSIPVSLAALAATHSSTIARKPAPVRQRPHPLKTSDPAGAAIARLVKSLERAGRTAPAGALAQHMTALWSRYMTWKMRRTTRVLLEALDDRTLRDVGLERSKIDVVVRGIR